MPGAEENLRRFKEKLNDETPIYPISALTKKGLRELLFAIADKLEEIPKEPLEEKPIVIKHHKEEPPFQIKRADDGAFVLYGEKIERLLKMTDFSTDEAAQRFARQLRRMGVDDALRERGAVDGSIVRILDYEFEFID